MKSIHWNIPFTSVKGDSYLLWIYDEGFTGNQVRLQAGQVPFTTEENTDTDFFSPVRGGTGSISIIDPNGTIMRSLLPDNNTSRPVRLMKFVYGVPQFVWQGFLTCNTYSQGYTNRPQEVSLQVASLLDAADSISAKQSNFSGLMTVRQIIHMCVAAIKDEFGRPASEELISTFFFPKADWRILNFWCDTSLFLDLKETENEEEMNHVVDGRSIKSILTSLCRFMGWCVRECPNRVLSFQRMNDPDDTYLYVSYADFADGNKSLGSVLHEGTKTVKLINNLEYRGVDHEKSTYAGAKSVEVVSNLKSYELGTKFPNVPYGSLIVNPSSRWTSQGEIYAGPTNSELDSNCVFRAMRATIYIPENMNDGSRFNLGSAVSSQTFFETTLFWMNNDFQSYYYDLILNHTKYGSSEWNVMAFMARYRGGDNTLKDGLVIYGATYGLRYGDQQFWPFSGDGLTSTNYLFRQKALLPFTATNGSIAIKINIGEFIFLHKGAVLNMTYYVPSLTIAVQFANKWAVKNGNTYSWSSSFSTIEVFFNSEGAIDNDSNEISIPIKSYMTGDVYIYVYHRMTGWGLYTYPGGVSNCYDPIIGMLINSIEVSYTKPELSSKRGVNHYFQLLGTNFSSEKVVSNDMATDMDNNESPSILLYTQNDKMQYMTYSYPSGDATERPEKDLLARLARYYKKRRSTIQLEVEHINDSLPTTRVIADGVPCEPIAESRDYQLDKTTVTLMEESASSE